jgi:hypothetical protein
MLKQGLRDAIWRHCCQHNPLLHQVGNTLGLNLPAQGWHHLVLRTLNLAPFSVNRLAPALERLGYQFERPYRWPDLHSRAYLYTAEGQPHVIVSELQVEELPAECQEILHGLTEQVQHLQLNEYPSPFAGRLWRNPTLQTIAILQTHSEFAAWLSIWGPGPYSCGIDLSEATAVRSMPDWQNFWQAQTQTRLHHLRETDWLLLHSTGIQQASPGGDERQVAGAPIVLVNAVGPFQLPESVLTAREWL